MQPNATVPALTARQERAALLVADDSKTDGAIAAELRVNKVTLERWKKRPEFAARVQEHKDAWRAALLGQGIADRSLRISHYNRRHTLANQVIDQRAADEEWAEVPGYRTGLLVRDVKISKEGDVYNIFSVDTGLLRELRELEKQAAQDLGQWEEKHQVTGDVLIREYAVPVEDV